MAMEAAARAAAERGAGAMAVAARVAEEKAVAAMAAAAMVEAATVAMEAPVVMTAEATEEGLAK